MPNKARVVFADANINWSLPLGKAMKVRDLLEDRLGTVGGILPPDGVDGFRCVEAKRIHEKRVAHFGKVTEADLGDDHIEPTAASLLKIANSNEGDE
mgnify:CR=1 FL=1